MRLYTQPGSCSSASHIALIEVGADFDFTVINLMGDRSLPDGRNLKDINPRGYVPALELDDGRIITENPVLLQFIGDLAPEKGLVPAWEDKEKRMELIGWLAYIGTEVHRSCSTLRTPNLSEEQHAMVLGRLNARLEYMNNYLAENDYVMDNKFSVADCYLFVVFSWGPKLGFDISPYENIVAYQQRIGARDSVKAYMEQVAEFLPKK